ncbi:competence protein ComEC [Streptococcus gallinaceus]|uniref:DNA internalization-related competence protein ComEC/Rec2 n=1 Tax=Streptococcus gallinaceus TaxID=165758 RepID=UPI00209C7B09|nr:DNA internalization-related competence protein ComEC/Rec2 [Streptococcus gallinaceus]MCP1638436.1 competence protein ComEC [Streptococcus gallinaceus]MCP1769477.1 competence protein ComEC [Streptococcus gallinaceus]
MSQWIKKTGIVPIHLALVLVAYYFLLFRFSVWSVLVAAGLTIRFLNIYRRKWRLVLPILLFCLLFFGGEKWLALTREAAAPDQVSQLVILPDTIKVNGDSLSFRGQSRRQTYQVFYKLKTQEEQAYFQNLTQLMSIEVEATVEKPAGRRNFNGFDYAAYLWTQGIYRTVRIEKIKAIAPQRSWNPLEWISSWRRQALVHIKQTFPSPMNHYMTGLLFGHLDSDFDEMSDIYSSLGIIHLFALSGMQVGFFMDLFRRLLLRCGLQREIVDWLQLPISFVYAGLTGYSVSVIRSLIQKIVGNFGVTRLDNLALTTMLCFLIAPHFLLTAGGVLSFTYALLLTVFDFEKLSGYKKILTESLTLSVGVLPVLIFYFYSFQPVSILLTFVFSFLFDSLLLPGLTAIFLVSAIYPLTQINIFFSFLEKIMLALADCFPHPLVFGKPDIPILLALLILLGMTYDLWGQKKWTPGLLACAALLFFLTKNPPSNEITVVDIGQGDSIFLRDKTGKNMLIDVGGRVSFAAKEGWQAKNQEVNAERTLIPYLRSRGIGQIDSLVLTHTDTDHVGDLLAVSKAFRIGTIYVSLGSLNKADFVETLRKTGAHVDAVEAGHQFSIFGSNLQVLYPFGAGDGGNNDSVVLYGQLLDKRFLFTGDLEKEGEEQLIEAYPDLAVDVLKAGHHGSKGSSDPAFLDHIKAKVALISAGEKNRYQHPHEETLARFSDQNMAVFRTDQQGAIRFYGWNTWKLETVR